jgi:hypothetical protein
MYDLWEATRMAWNFLRVARSWSRGDLARALASRKRSRPAVEVLEDRTLLTVVSQGLYVNSATATNTGTFMAVHGGFVEVGVNTSLDNSGGQLTGNGGSGVFNFGTIKAGSLMLTNGSTLHDGNDSYPGTIAGSTLNLTGGSTLQGTGTLSNITVPVGSDLIVPASASQTLKGTITDNGMIELQPAASANVYLAYSGSVTLAGTGEMLLDPEVNGNHVVTPATDGSSTLTNGAGHTIECIGKGWFGTTGLGSVVNEGLLEANGGNLIVSSASATNTGILKAINGGRLAVDENTNLDDRSQGVIEAAGSTVVNSGTISGGTVELTGASTLQNGYFSSTNGPYPGVISGSTLNLTGGSKLTGLMGNPGTLKNITIAPDSALDLSSNSGQTISGTLTDDGQLTVQSGTANLANSTLEVDGTGILVMPSAADLQIGGNLIGQTQNAHGFAPQGEVLLNGSGTAVAPQLLEVMGRDLNDVAAGFQDNFAYGMLALGNDTYVRLVDKAGNTGQILQDLRAVKSDVEGLASSGIDLLGNVAKIDPQLAPLVALAGHVDSLIVEFNNNWNAWNNASGPVVSAQGTYLNAVRLLRLAYAALIKANENCPPENPPVPPVTPTDTRDTGTVFSQDPNSMVGPAGYGAQNFVADTATLPYQVNFENDPTATAPAQRVDMSDPLDPKLDWSTFQLAAVGFGSTYITIPAGLQHYDTTLNVTENGQTFEVAITLNLNPATGMFAASFQSIDPSTGLPPASLLTGFLPPEDGSGRGIGFVSFTVRPKAGLSTGTQITNVAQISFDQGQTIATDQKNDLDPTQGIDATKQALVTIDAGPPTSSIISLSPVTNSTSFTVSWSGSEPGGPGVASYDVYVSVGGGPFSPWLTGTSQTTAVYSGAFGHSYAFYSVATDPLGFRQPTPGAAQASTVLEPPLAPPVSPHPVGVTLRTRRFGKHKKLVAEVLFSGGLPAREVVAPFQKPAFQGLRAVLQDLDGDGTFDSLLFTARKGKKQVSRVVPV